MEQAFSIICILLLKRSVIFLSFSTQFCDADRAACADQQQDAPENRIACVAGFGGVGILIACRLDLKFRAALAVVINNRQGVLADGQCGKIILFQRDDRGAGSSGLLLCGDCIAVDLNASELGEIAAGNEFQRAVRILCPDTVCALDDFVIRSCASVLRRYRKIGDAPHGAVGTVACIAFIALIIHKFAVDLQLRVAPKYVADIFDIAVSRRIHTVMISLSGFKSSELVFIEISKGG